MNAKDIAGRKFEKSFNGYKPDDVDEFLQEISADYSAMQKENRDLEKKLEVLADKIREYRNDEDVLKEALLGAQRQGNLAITEAKEKAAKIIQDAEQKSEKILKDANEEDKKIREECQKHLKESNENANIIITEATEKAERINHEMITKTEIQKETLFRIKNEVSEFTEKLITGYKKHISNIEAFPEQCENDYLDKTFSEYKKDRNVTLKKQSGSVEKNIEQEKPLEEKIKSIRFGEQQEKVNRIVQESKQESIFGEIKDNSNIVDNKKPVSFEINVEETEKETSESEFQFKSGVEKDNLNERGKLSNINNNDNKDKNNLFFKKASSNNIKNDNKLEFGNNIKVLKKK